jgi:hypothetical protein
MNTKSRTLLVAALASTLALPLAAEEEKKTSEFKDSSFTCWGINTCKGTGACSATGRREDGCSGSNACRGQGFLRLDPDTCLKIQGGRLEKAKRKKAAAQPKEKHAEMLVPDNPWGI